MELLKSSRNFIVHATPIQPKFHTEMEKIMLKNKGGIYSETASQIIAYIVNNIKRSKKVPAWLDNNTLIKIHEIEYLGGDIENPLRK